MLLALAMRRSYNAWAYGRPASPGGGQNFQDHFGIGCVWEYQATAPLRNNAGEATFFWKSNPGLVTPDLQTCLGEVPICSAETPPSSIHRRLLGRCLEVSCARKAGVRSA